MVAVATLGFAAAPAYAADIDVKLSQDSVTLSPGQTSESLTARLTNNKDTPMVAQVTISAPDQLGDVQVQASDPSCSGSGTRITCNTSLPAGKGQTKDISFTLSAKSPGSVQPGETKRDTGSVRVAFGGQADFGVTLKGPDKTEEPTVKEVSGVVRDTTTGNPIPSAVVVFADSGRCSTGSDPSCKFGTNAQGQFKFTSTADRPIKPGTIRIIAGKSGFAEGTAQVDAKAGESVRGIQIKLKPSAEASTSASAEALPSAEAGPPTAEAVTPTGAAEQERKNTSSSGTSALTWVILVLAGLLVLLGVGVFVVMFLNRKKGEGDDDQGGNGTPPAGPNGGAAMPAGPGGYGGDATMVGHPGMTQAMGMPGASDATAIIRPQRPEDEFPDPYAAPYPTSPAGYPPAGGYGADPYATQVGGYPPGQQAGYDSGATVAGYAGQPASAYGPGAGHGGDYGAPAGYGGGQQGYGGPTGGPAPRYDEATRHWEDPNAGGYPAGGAPQQGGYGQPPQGGYDPRAGHDPAGYPPPQDPYHQDPHQQQARRGAPPAPGRGGDQRLDWLDD